MTMWRILSVVLLILWCASAATTEGGDDQQVQNRTDSPDVDVIVPHPDEVLDQDGDRWKFALNKKKIPFPLKFKKKKKKKKKPPFLTFITRTETSTVTEVATAPTVGLCAKLVNVTGACRLRRGLWVEDPIVLTFDDGMDNIDGLLSPSHALSIETTLPPDEGRAMTSSSNDKEGERQLTGSPIIEPSIEGQAEGQPEEDEDYEDEDGEEEDAAEDEVEDEEHQRLGFRPFHAIKHVMKTVKKRLKFHLVTVVSTTVSTTTSTSTFYSTVSLKTFFIQLCTPSPFPFNICSGRK